MEGMTITSVVSEYEIERYVAKHNRFFQLRSFTLDDLKVYAEPMNEAISTMQRLAYGAVTHKQAMDAMRRAASQYKAIDDAMGPTADARDVRDNADAW